MGAAPSARKEPDPAHTDTPTGPAHKACAWKIERSDGQSKGTSQYLRRTGFFAASNAAVCEGHRLSTPVIRYREVQVRILKPSLGVDRGLGNPVSPGGGWQRCRPPRRTLTTESKCFEWGGKQNGDCGCLENSCASALWVRIPPSPLSEGVAYWLRQRNANPLTPLRGMWVRIPLLPPAMCGGDRVTGRG